MARAARDQGRTSFDMGCFQVNYRWHGEHFASLEAMLDPDTNAVYAAQFLAALWRESGSWSVAAGHYHSRTKAHSDRYRQIFERHYAALQTGDLDLPAPVVAVVRQNGYPLLRDTGGGTALGSLVPMGPRVERSFLTGGPARPFWSG